MPCFHALWLVLKTWNEITKASQQKKPQEVRYAQSQAEAIYWFGAMWPQEAQALIAYQYDALSKHTDNFWRGQRTIDQWGLLVQTRVSLKIIWKKIRINTNHLFLPFFFKKCRASLYPCLHMAFIICAQNKYTFILHESSRSTEFTPVQTMESNIFMDVCVRTWIMCTHTHNEMLLSGDLPSGLEGKELWRLCRGWWEWTGCLCWWIAAHVCWWRCPGGRCRSPQRMETQWWCFSAHTEAGCLRCLHPHIAEW